MQSEPHRTTAIRKLARVIEDIPGYDQVAEERAAAIVDSITSHAVEVARALIKAERELER